MTDYVIQVRRHVRLRHLDCYRNSRLSGRMGNLREVGPPRHAAVDRARSTRFLRWVTTRCGRVLSMVLGRWLDVPSVERSWILLESAVLGWRCISLRGIWGGRRFRWNLSSSICF